MGKLPFSSKNSQPVAQLIFNIVFYGLVFGDSEEMAWGMVDMGGVVSSQFKPTANLIEVSGSTMYFQMKIKNVDKYVRNRTMC